MSASADRDTNRIDSHDVETEQQFIAYLAKHPDFFRRHPGVLADMSLPHNSGGAVSLVERQVAILRERSIEARHKLGELINNALENDKLFEKTQSLVTRILKASSFTEIFSLLQKQFQQRFDVQHTGIFLLTDGELTAQPGQFDPVYVKPLAEAKQKIPNVLASEPSFCGVLRETEASFIFGESSTVQSSAIACRKLTFANHNWQLVIGVGHGDSAHYGKDTGTLFLDYIADIVQLILQRDFSIDAIDKPGDEPNGHSTG